MTVTDPTSRFMTGADVAAMFHTSESTVRYWKYCGKLRGFRVGRRTLYDRADVEALIHSATVGGAA